MKTKKLIGILLSAVLVFTTVFAGAGSVYAETETPKDYPVVGAIKSDEGTMKAAANDESNNTVTATSINVNQSAVTYSTRAYGGSTVALVGVKIPKAGAFMFNILAGNSGTVELYKSYEAGAKPIASMPIYKAYSVEDYDTFYASVNKAGTYYLIFSTESYAETQSFLRCYYAPAGGTPTVSKNFYGASPKGVNSGWSYYKITTAGLRYLTISFPDRMKTDSLYQVKLMNSTKKKNLSKGIIGVGSGKSWTTYAAVPKGTYYVAVKCSDPMYAINLKATKVTENSGSTRTKAKSIYKGNTKKGLITATQSSTSADWYKIKINSSQKVNLEVITKTGGYNGGIRISVFRSGKTKAFGSSDFYWDDPASTLQLYTSGYGGRLSKGTYYIKVQKYGCGSGYYQIKWK